ncbi:hypothetical protein RJT34_12608 [Clitoria ternatea]|uniref:ARM repeat superfamily protein n=1 Tax=Clitoria ternatea TaxID=43366 RepID=A0AAN9JP38_CLITE
MPFLQHAEVEHRVYAFKLTRLISEWFNQDIANELRISDKLTILNEKLFDYQSTNDERSDAAQIFANLSLSEGLQEGLIGLLLHFTRNLDQQTLNIMRENRLIMAVFCEQLDYISKPKATRLAAIGLKNLSEFGRSVTAKDSEPPSSSSFCSSLVLLYGKASSESSTCPIDNSLCEEDSQLCLLKSNCIRPLVDILNDNDTNVQLAAVDALSILVSIHISQPEELQEKTIWMIEKVLRVENLSNRHALNQAFVRGLVEAFKHGNPNTRKHAQDALILLKQLSGVSGKASRESQAR